MSFLQRIIARKRSEILDLDPPQNPAKCARDFVLGLRSKQPALIAEVKPKSPSAGLLLDREAVPALVARYNQCAQAISVLCDEPDFGGGYDLLVQVRSLSDLPILAKEFIVDVSQINLARSKGADAILLIAAALSDQEINRLAARAIELNMAVLFEIHTAEEIKKIPDLPSESLIIGINNRSLDDLAIDLKTTEKLAPLVRKKFPKHLLISESGIKNDADFKRLSFFVDGFLVGTGLLTNYVSNGLLSEIAQ